MLTKILVSPYKPQLLGLSAVLGYLHVFYCPEKPVVARFRQKFQDDVAKARQLRDEKQYPFKRFIFITPEALREPDQRMLRDFARDTGFEDGINMSEEHLEVFLARNMEILLQFPELSYPHIEQKLDHVLSIVEKIQRSQESISRAQPTSKITGAPAQILMLAVKAANKAIAGMAEAEEIIRILDLTKYQYKDGVEELNALGVIDIFRSANAPAGYQRVRVCRDAFIQIAAQVLPGVYIKTELGKLLQAFALGGGEYVAAPS